MIYKHPFFALDPAQKTVYDENLKELRITGNTYRVLAFLCLKHQANLSEIGAELDWASDYTENHIRQYRYKINTIIGHDVIAYRNGLFLIDGAIEEAKENVVGDSGNTDLLQANPLPLKYMEQISSKISKVPAIIVGLLLLAAVVSLPYSYYGFMRFVVTIGAIYYAYLVHKTSSQWLFWTFVLTAVIFNPIWQLQLTRTLWRPIDLFFGVFYLSVPLIIDKFIIKKETV